jgi:hypothetical protein
MKYTADVEIRIPTKQYAFISVKGYLCTDIADDATDEEVLALINRVNKIALLAAQKQALTINRQMKEAQEKSAASSNS